MPIEALRSVSEHFDRILRSVNPKRIAMDMAKADKAFHFRHFKGYRLDQIGRGRIKRIAQREIFKGDGHELFANLIIIYWNNEHGKLYEELVTHVKSVNEDVEAIERIDAAKAHAIIDDLLTRHERPDVHLVARLNGVRFDDEVFESRFVRGEDAPAADVVTEDAAPAAAPAADADGTSDAGTPDAGTSDSEAPATE